MKQRDPYTLKDRSPLTQEFEDGTKEERDLSETIIAGYKDYSLSGKVGINASDKLQIEAKGGYYFNIHFQKTGIYLYPEIMISIINTTITVCLKKKRKIMKTLNGTSEGYTIRK